MNKDIKPKGKAGRPRKYVPGLNVKETEYDATHPERLLDLMQQGKLDCQIFTILGIGKNTYYRWLREHEEFKQAHEIGLPACEAWWIEWGMKGMQGEIKGFSFNSWIAFMNNKFNWAKNAAQGGNNTQINIGTINTIENKNSKELIEFIQQKALLTKVIDVEYNEPEDLTRLTYEEPRGTYRNSESS